MAELIVRAPNYLGDLVMALPALRAAGAAERGGAVDVQIRRWLVPLLEMASEGEREAGRAPYVGRVLPLDRGARGMLRAAAALRRGRYARGVLLPGSFSSALLFALGGVRQRRGLLGDARGALLTEGIDRARIAGLHRAAEALLLVGAPADGAPAPRIEVPAPLRREAERELGAAAGPWVGVVPTASASSRRWEVGRFAELVRRLYARGLRVVVFGGPDDAALTRRAAGEHGLDWGGRTTLPGLAAALAACSLVASNDSGPLHLAAAVGTPTVSLWGAGDPGRTGLIGAEHQLLRRPDLPCVPCVRNVCPRSGPGYRLPHAERECLQLISVDDVEAAVLRGLDRTLSPT